MKFNGNILKKLRLESGLKPREWRKMIQIPSTTLFMYENNRRTPSAENMLKICINLGKPIEFFYEACSRSTTEINK